MEILRDLLWTLYSKLDAVLQGHRFVLDIIDKISKVRIVIYIILMKLKIIYLIDFDIYLEIRICEDYRWFA